MLAVCPISIQTEDQSAHVSRDSSGTAHRANAYKYVGVRYEQQTRWNGEQLLFEFGVDLVEVRSAGETLFVRLLHLDHSPG